MKHLIAFSQTRPLSFSNVSLFSRRGDGPELWKKKYIDRIEEEGRKVYYDKGSALELYLDREEAYKEKYLLSMSKSPSPESNMFVFVNELVKNKQEYDRLIESNLSTENIQIHTLVSEKISTITGKPIEVPLYNINTAYLASGYKIDISRVLSSFKEYLDYYIECTDNTHVYLDAKEFADIEQAKNSLVLSEFTKDIFNPGEGIEVINNLEIVTEIDISLFLGTEGLIKSFLGYSDVEGEVTPNKILVKVIFDKVLINHATKTVKIVDLKTMSDKVHNFESSIRSYNYNLQDLFYVRVAENCEQFKGYRIDGVEFIVASFNDYKVAKYRISNQDKYASSYGYKDLYGNKHRGIVHLLEDLNWHLENNLWEYERGIYESDGVYLTNLFGYK
jgi:hypothetical protein